MSGDCREWDALHADHWVNDTSKASTSLRFVSICAPLVFKLLKCDVCPAHRQVGWLDCVITSWIRWEIGMVEVHDAEALLVHGPMLASTVVRGWTYRVMSKVYGSVSRVTRSDEGHMFQEHLAPRKTKAIWRQDTLTYGHGNVQIMMYFLYMLTIFVRVERTVGCSISIFAVDAFVAASVSFFCAFSKSC